MTVPVPAVLEKLLSMIGDERDDDTAIELELAQSVLNLRPARGTATASALP